MKLSTAINVLNKEADFLGMTFAEVIVFIQRNPYVATMRSLEALEVYNKETV